MALFCQNCGKADQTPGTYCRSCGEFQPDYSRPGRSGVTVNGYFLASGIFSTLCIIWIIALVAGHMLDFVTSESSDFLTKSTIVMLLAMGAWNSLNLYYAITLKKRFDHYRIEGRPPVEPKKVKGIWKSELLNPARFDDNIPASLVDDTTKTLDDKVPR